MSKIPSVMTHKFSEVPSADIPRSTFNRSHGLKTAFDAGYLVPIYVDEVYPGDTFQMNLTMFGRLATPLHPVMDNLFLDTQFFFVPNRLLWDNWQKFQGEQLNPNDSTDYVVPTMTSTTGTGYANGTLHDYFGIPTQVPDLEHSSLWHRAYNLIYNEWYRDQNLQDSVVVDSGDGPDNPADYVLLKRGKRHDYFTSALPWPQKGPAVDLPLGTSAPVTGLAITPSASYITSVPTYRESDGTLATGSNWAQVDTGGGGSIYVQEGSTSGYPNITADLSAATAATINELRQSFQIQKLYERDARGGTRYTEIIRAHFGVTSPDARLQRPEYLGGSSSPININPIAQTSSTDATTPQGNLAAMGVVSNHGGSWLQSFTEHGVIIGLASLRADLTYQQGLNRMFSRSTRFDYYMPALAHLGEQELLNKEIYAQGTADDDLVFGYQERWAEMRYKPSQITGKFRSNDAQSLDTWHLSQDFTALPALNSSFIEENPPLDRVIAVTSEPHLILDTYFNLKCTRPLPLYSVPGLIDHF